MNLKRAVASHIEQKLISAPQTLQEAYLYGFICTQFETYAHFRRALNYFLGQNPTCLQMFETLHVLNFAESYLISFMPDKEYNTFLGQKPAVDCQENLMTRGISLAVLKRQ